MGKLDKQLEFDALGPTFSRPSPSTCPYSNFCLMFNVSFFKISSGPLTSLHQLNHTWATFNSLKLSKTLSEWSESCSVVSDSLWPHRLYNPWNSPCQNTGVGSLSLLKGIFPTQGSNPALLHWRQILYQLSYPGSPSKKKKKNFFLNSHKSHWPKFQPLLISFPNIPVLQEAVNWPSALQFSHSVVSDWFHRRKHTKASLSIINSQSSLKVMSIESVMPFNHLILCCPLFLLPSNFPSIRVFSNESVFHIRWPKYWSFSISPSNEYSGLISFRMDWLDLLAVQGTLKSLLQHHR